MFVIMVQEGNAAELLRYQAFSKSEPEIRQLYHQMIIGPAASKAMENDVGGGDVHTEFVSPDDLALRERFVVLSTSAVLSIPRHRRTCAGGSC